MGWLFGWRTCGWMAGPAPSSDGTHSLTPSFLQLCEKNTLKKIHNHIEKSCDYLACANLSMVLLEGWNEIFKGRLYKIVHHRYMIWYVPVYGCIESFTDLVSLISDIWLLW